MLNEIWVSDNYYTVEEIPPFSREVIKVAALLDVNLDGVCKVSVSFLRDDLTAQKLHLSSPVSRAIDAKHSREVQHSLGLESGPESPGDGRDSYNSQEELCQCEDADHSDEGPAVR